MAAETFKAIVGAVLGWDQKECTVLLIPGGPGPADFMRAHRGAEIEVTVVELGKETVPAQPAKATPMGATAALVPSSQQTAEPSLSQPGAAQPAGQGELFGKGRRWGAAAQSSQGAPIEGPSCRK